MSILSDLKNKLFKTEAIQPVPSYDKYKLNRFSFGKSTPVLRYDTGIKIMKDITVSMSYDILKYLLSSKQWVLIANDNDIDSNVYNFIHNMLFNMDTEVNTIVKRLIDALPWGFHVEELIFNINDDGKLILKDTVPVSIKTLQNQPFIYNDNGELTGIHQVYEQEEVDIPINKCLKYTFGDSDSDYGHGLLLDVKELVEYKTDINNWLMTFLERHSLPSLVGKTNNPISRDEMLSAFKDMHDGTLGMTVGLEDEVNVLESSHHGETFFSSFSYFDNQIVKRFYIGDLLMGTTGSTGSYARSNTQLDFTQLIFDGILEEIANCIQQQIINPIVEANFTDISLSPTFSFDKFTSGDLQGLFTTIKPLIDSGIVDSENDAVQDSIALLFKKETGLNYVNTVEPVEEDFNLEPLEDAGNLTEAMINNIEV